MERGEENKISKLAIFTSILTIILLVSIIIYIGFGEKFSWVIIFALLSLLLPVIIIIFSIISLILIKKYKLKGKTFTILSLIIAILWVLIIIIWQFVSSSIGRG